MCNYEEVSECLNAMEDRLSMVTNPWFPCDTFCKNKLIRHFAAKLSLSDQIALHIDCAGSRPCFAALVDVSETNSAEKLIDSGPAK